MADVLLLNGPNLGSLGARQVEIYGRTALAEIEKGVDELVSAGGHRLHAYQSDSEAELIAALRSHAGAAGAVINPGALMIAGWSLRDALEGISFPFVEVHISNVWKRERFRHRSVISPLASGVIVGLGTDGYLHATRALLAMIARFGAASGRASGL